MVTFREALDAVCLSATEASELFGVEAQTIRQMRLEPDNPSARTPPAGWQKTLATLAREKSKHLSKLADELEAQ